jgi:hypothetical protein
VKVPEEYPEEGIKVGVAVYVCVCHECMCVCMRRLMDDDYKVMAFLTLSGDWGCTTTNYTMSGDESIFARYTLWCVCA